MPSEMKVCGSIGIYSGLRVDGTITKFGGLVVDPHLLDRHLATVTMYKKHHTDESLSEIILVTWMAWPQVSDDFFSARPASSISMSLGVPVIPLRLDLQRWPPT